MVYKIEIQRPGCWEVMRKMDGTDLEYTDEEYDKAFNLKLSIEGCYKLIDKNINIEVKKV